MEILIMKKEDLKIGKKIYEYGDDGNFLGKIKKMDDFHIVLNTGLKFAIKKNKNSLNDDIYLIRIL
jgi:hypothetical protein